MKKQILSAVLIIFLMSNLLLNCDCYHACTSVPPIAVFENFDSSKLTTVLVKPYIIAGPSIDSQKLIVYTSTKFPSGHILGLDTQELKNDTFLLEGINNYVITIPALGRTWNLTNIHIVPTKLHENSCTNGFTYHINDTLYTIPSYPYSSNAVMPILLK